MRLDGASVSRPDAATVVPHLQHLATQLMTDDAWKRVIGLLPVEGVPIAAADDDTVDSHQRLARLAEGRWHDLSHELPWRIQNDLSHVLPRNSRIEHLPGGMLPRTGCLTVLGAQRAAYPSGKPWDRQPVSGKLRRKLGVSPGFAAHFGALPTKRLGTPAHALHAAHEIASAIRRPPVQERTPVPVSASPIRHPR
jgi:hypothetical protein